jgi:flagellar protein FliO/FliZ
VFAALALGATLFLFNIPVGFAQDAPESAAAEAPVEDPIAAAERGLPLDGAETGTLAAPGASSIGVLLRMLLTLAVAAAAIYGVIYFIKRASRRVEVKDPFLKVLASTHLGSNRYAHVVAVGSKAWLVGAAENGVNLISEIEDKDVLNALFLEDSRKNAETPAGQPLDFKSILRRLGMAVPAGAAGADQLRKRRERLKGL